MNEAERAFLDGLLARGATAGVRVEGPAADAFRDHVVVPWDGIVQRLADDRRRRFEALGPRARRCLERLREVPSLLGPLGRHREENTHSDVLAWLLSQDDETGRALRRAWSRLTQMAVGPTDWTVRREVWIEVPPRWRRLDLHVDVAGRWLGYVEVKVDAGEGAGQLRDQAAHLDGVREARGIETSLVFLTLDGRAPEDGTPALTLAFHDVVRAFLPHVADPGPTATYLALWCAGVVRDLYRLGDDPLAAEDGAVPHRTLLTWLEEVDG